MPGHFNALDAVYGLATDNISGAFEVETHEKTDRLIVIDDEEPGHSVFLSQKLFQNG